MLDLFRSEIHTKDANWGNLRLIKTDGKIPINLIEKLLHYVHVKEKRIHLVTDFECGVHFWKTSQSLSKNTKIILMCQD